MILYALYKSPEVLSKPRASGDDPFGWENLYPNST